MAIADFHPVVSAWFEKTYGEPSPPQREGWTIIAAQEHCLILAPAVRTGDTSQRERNAMIKRPPQVLITTPESLYLMLTSKAREILRTVRYVIVDEIHAVCATKRGVGSPRNGAVRCEGTAERSNRGWVTPPHRGGVLG